MEIYHSSKRYMAASMTVEVNNMKVAVLSGKGGTGKTFLSVNMAASMEDSQYIDCDVEEPNGHLFLKPGDLTVEEVGVNIPHVDQGICNGCRKCVEFCKFNALAYTDKLILFDDICHSCGGCIILCPVGALTERDKPIGEIQKGKSRNVTVHSGILNIGVPSGVPIIERLLESKENSKEVSIIDCPPGSSCIVMESIKNADYCLLVAEPTLFGVHNLNMVYELVRLFNKPHGVVLNKCLEGEENPAERYCVEKGIRILERIPFDNELGELNSKGLVAAWEREEYKSLFGGLMEKILGEVRHEAITNP